MDILSWLPATLHHRFSLLAGKDATLPLRWQKSSQILPASDLFVRAILIIEDVVNI